MKRVAILLLSAFCLSAGPALLKPAPEPESPSALASISRYNKALQASYDAWRDAQAKAENQLVVDLNASIKQAMASSKSDEVVVLTKLRKAAEDRITQLKHPAIPTTWKFSSGATVELHDDGKCTANNGHTGIWKRSGQTIVCSWDNQCMDTLVLAPDGQSVTGLFTRPNGSGTKFTATPVTTTHTTD
jgi:hypothetical protein